MQDKENKFNLFLFDNLSNLIYTFIGDKMNKEFSNIIIFNNKDILEIKEKIEKIILDLEYSLVNIEDSSYYIDIINDNINNICVINSNFFKFEGISENKSVIRKISKRLAQDTFMVTSKDDFAVVEKYSFNKRVYDYICFGNRSRLESLGYSEAYATYMYQEIWKNHFVGRNTINDVNKLLKEEKTFFNSYEIIVEILKLYGIKYELVVYNSNDTLSSNEYQRETLYFK